MKYKNRGSVEEKYPLEIRELVKLKLKLKNT